MIALTDSRFAVAAAAALLLAGSGDARAQAVFTNPSIGVQTPMPAPPNLPSGNVPVIVIPGPQMTPPTEALLVPPELLDIPGAELLPDKPTAEELLGTIGDPTARSGDGLDLGGFRALAGATRGTPTPAGEEALRQGLSDALGAGAPAAGGSGTDYSARNAQGFIQGNIARSEANRPTGNRSGLVSDDAGTNTDRRLKAARFRLDTKERKLRAKQDRLNDVLRTRENAKNTGDTDLVESANEVLDKVESARDKAKVERDDAEAKVKELEAKKTEEEEAKSPTMPLPDGGGTQAANVPDELQRSPHIKGGDVDPTPEGGPVVAEVTPKKPSEDELKAMTKKGQAGLSNWGGGDNENAGTGGNEQADQFREAVGGPREPGFGGAVDPTDPAAGKKAGNKGFTGLE